MIDFETNFLSSSVIVVKVRGKLDDSTRRYFFSCISDLMESGAPKHVIVECNGLGSLSSSGMAALLSARNSIAKSGGKIYFTHLSSVIATALKLTKLNKLLAIYPTTEEVLRRIEDEIPKYQESETPAIAH